MLTFCICMCIFTIPLSLLPLLFRWQRHSFSSYLDIVFSEQKHCPRVLRVRGITSKKFGEGENTREICIYSSDSPHVPGTEKQGTGAYNETETNRHHLQPCEQKRTYLVHHSRMHSLCFYPQCKEGKIEGKQPICDAYHPRIDAPYSWEGFETTQKRKDCSSPQFWQQTWS